MNNWYKLLILGFLLSTATVLQAKVTLPQFFSSNMVLQRDMPIRIWGWADRNESVIIIFNGITEKVKTGKTGKWSLNIPAMQFGGPFTLTVSGKDNTITYDNILIGDVWLCSGQSMTYGKQNLGSGPVYEDMRRDGNKIMINFSNTGIGLTTKDKNKYGYVFGFSVAGKDKMF